MRNFQVDQNNSFTNQFSNFLIYPLNWTKQFQQKIDIWYQKGNETVQAYFADPISYQPQEIISIFPTNIQKTVETEQQYLQLIRQIKAGVKRKEYFPKWIDKLRDVFKLVENNKLSAWTYQKGVQKLLELGEPLPRPLNEWFAFVNNTIEQLKKDQSWIEQQFRLAIYVGLMQVIHHQINPQTWLNQLAEYKSLLEEDLYSEALTSIENFIHIYLSAAVYEIPLYAYSKLTADIETILNPAEGKNSKETADAAIPTLEVIQQIPNYITDFSKIIYTSITQNPTKTMFYGLVALGLYHGFTNFSNSFSWPAKLITSFAPKTSFAPNQNQNLFLNPARLIVGLEFLASIPIINTQNVTATFINEFDNFMLNMGGILTKSANILLAGSYQPAAHQGISLIELTPDGNVVNANGVLSLGPDDIYVLNGRKSITLTTDGGWAISAFTNGLGVTSPSYVVIKWNDQGGLSWVKTLTGGNGGGQSDPMNIISTADDGIIVYGHTTSFANPCLPINNYADNPLIAKLNNTGDLLWSTHMGVNISGCAFSPVTGFSRMTDGGFAAAGTAEGCHPNPSGRVIGVMKIDSNGHSVWASAAGGNATDQVSGIFTADGVATTDNGIIIFGYGGLGGSGQYPFVIMKWDNEGNFLWAKTLNYPSDSFIQAYGITATLDGVIFLGRNNLQGSVFGKINNNGTYEWGSSLKYGSNYAAGNYLFSLFYDNNNLYLAGCDGGCVGKSTGALGLVKLDSLGNTTNCNRVKSLLAAPFWQYGDVTQKIIAVPLPVVTVSAGLTTNDVMAGISYVTINSSLSITEFCSPLVTTANPTTQAVTTQTISSTTTQISSATSVVSTTQAMTTTNTLMTTGYTSDAVSTSTSSTTGTTNYLYGRPPINNGNSGVLTYTISGVIVAAGIGVCSLAFVGVCVYKYRSKKKQPSSELERYNIVELEQPRPTQAYSSTPTTPQSLSPTASSNANVQTATVTPPISNASAKSTNINPSTNNNVAEEFVIEFKNLTFGETLGRGAFGIVYKGKWLETQVAIKQLILDNPTEEILQDFQKEMQIMSKLRNPNVVQFYGVCNEPGHHCIVMEYMNKGSLYTVLHNMQPLDWLVRERIALDITRGLVFLHASNVIHRDLKSLNVLLNEHYQAKLSDFGLAKIKTETASTLSKNEQAGTLAWMAPELFDREKPSKKSDIYSYGMVLWELASRGIPFSEANGNQVLVMKWINEEKHDEIPKETPPKIAHLIKWCWAKTPTARPDANEALKFLEENDDYLSYKGNLDSGMNQTLNMANSR